MLVILFRHGINRHLVSRDPLFRRGKLDFTNSARRRVPYLSEMKTVFAITPDSNHQSTAFIPRPAETANFYQSQPNYTMSSARAARSTPGVDAYTTFSICMEIKVHYSSRNRRGSLSERIVCAACWPLLRYRIAVKVFTMNKGHATPDRRTLVCQCAAGIRLYGKKTMSFVLRFSRFYAYPLCRSIRDTHKEGLRRLHNPSCGQHPLEARTSQRSSGRM